MPSMKPWARIPKGWSACNRNMLCPTWSGISLYKNAPSRWVAGCFLCAETALLYHSRIIEN
jgi:hypothetical protein